MATLIKRGKTWSAVISVGTDATGKRKRIWKSGYATRREANRAGIEFESALNNGTYVQPSKVTFAEYLSRDWLPAKTSVLKATTVRSYECHIKQHIAPHIGSVPLQGLTGAHLNRLYSTLLTSGRAGSDSGLSASTVRRVHAVASKALNDAVRWNLIPRNPAVSCDPPKQRHVKKEIGFWTPEETGQFLKLVAEDSEWVMLWRLLLATGVRRGESLGLRWADVDFEHSAITVIQSLVTVGYQPQFTNPKSGKRRRVDLDPVTVSMLRRHKRDQNEFLLENSIRNLHGLVFMARSGDFVHPDKASKSFQAAIRRTGVKRIRLHDCRHTHGAHLAREGVHPKVVQERLGHHSITVTLDTYGHLFPSMQKDAAEAVQRLFS